MEPLQVSRRLVIPADELAVRFSRAGGPGGQNVNKVETRVALRWSIAHSAALSEEQRERLLERLGPRLVGEGELLVQAARHRERGRNLEDARERLAALVRAALAPVRKRRPTKPTRASKKRRLDAKRRRGDVKRTRREPPE